jgi:uncharacterized protein YbjT (DUF2867 family)
MASQRPEADPSDVTSVPHASGSSGAVTRVLVTGATGYVGGRLVPALLDQGHTVRCVTRGVGRLRDVPWRKRAEVVEGDVFDAGAMRRALADVEVAYYLVHSLKTGDDFESRDREAAATFAAAAKEAGVRRIVYLGGLSPHGTALSPHLRSRTEVGDVFLTGDVPAVVLRAAVILGSGSASFEMLRYLTERLPVMVTPRWVRNRIQPIAIRDVIRYLAQWASLPGEVNRSFDIGGPDVFTYIEMMQRYAHVAGLRRRLIIPVPVLSPSLSSHWVNFVTPVPSAIARPLIESLRNEVICGEHDIAQWIPDPGDGLIGFEQAVQLALTRVTDSVVPTRWSNATWPNAPSDPLPSDPDWSGGSLYVDDRTSHVNASPEELWRIIEGIGGEHGWYSWSFAWTLRGWMDRVTGGVGLRRGRRDPAHLYVGEALDFWRVEEIIAGQLLRLRAEMKLPGTAWLELTVGEDEAGTYYRQRAVFRPRGLGGHAYWRAIAPFHGIVFGGMVRNIVRAAE